MATTTSEILTIDGVALNTHAYNVSTRNGRLNIPGTKTPDVPAGGHGELYVPNKLFEPGVFVINMWVRGVDVDGNVPGVGYKRTWRTNVDTLQRLLGKQHGLLYITQVQLDGTVRECYGRVSNAIAFETSGNLPMTKMSIEITIPTVFWQDTANQTHTYTLTGAPPVTRTLTEFSAATAPMEDLDLRVVGPISSPKLTDVATGIWVQYTGAIAAGSTWQVLPGTWESKTLSGTNLLAQTDHSGHERFFVLTPSSSGPQLKLEGSGVTAGTSQLQVLGRRKYFS